MTRDQAVEIACTIMALVKHSKKNYNTHCDGFCGECPAARTSDSDFTWTYRNSGKELRFIEKAVRERLVRKGIEPDFGVLKELHELWVKIEKDEMEER